MNLFDAACAELDEAVARVEHLEGKIATMNTTNQQALAGIYDKALANDAVLDEISALCERTTYAVNAGLVEPQVDAVTCDDIRAILGKRPQP
jgi:hypothetical protein